ncbi:hypothetical protein NP233_g4295 [Leucocoprinus birnbaumii]|uniref:TRIP4/RQT4 C2HC5-type zinc finger domain-containing protein n=1 Tax=Leucocoprinus birnbaumii TaxID=56174 RepID=A0AAD5VVL6_9AGAR|nr:hypothetical protein NP233_g4295 [Leucocoprinus birnbaumii]
MVVNLNSGRVDDGQLGNQTSVNQTLPSPHQPPPLLKRRSNSAQPGTPLPRPSRFPHRAHTHGPENLRSADFLPRTYRSQRRDCLSLCEGGARSFSEERSVLIRSRPDEQSLRGVRAAHHGPFVVLEPATLGDATGPTGPISSQLIISISHPIPPIPSLPHPRLSTTTHCHRLTPKPKPQQQKSKPKSSGKSTPSNNNSEPEIPKSRAVRELETLIARLSATASSSSPTRDPKGGCFCLAREHPLSQHTPSCPSCALPLCTLNPPYNLCPSPACSQPLLTTHQITSLLTSLELQLAQILAGEERERQRLIEETKRAEGAFPTLSRSGTSTPTQTVAAPVLRLAHETSHKILSLTSTPGKSTSGKQKIKLISISHTPTPTSSRPASGTSTPLRAAEEEIIRVPPPPTEVEYVKGKPDKDRPWRNALLAAEGREIKYVPPPKGEGKEESGMSRNQRRKKNQKAREGEGKEKENFVPGSSNS